GAFQYLEFACLTFSVFLQTRVFAFIVKRFRVFRAPLQPEQWSHYTQINADFFAELGSPGGAAKVGMTENDPQAVKDLAPQSEDA
ncbi:hypothetical protein ABLO03_00680, partial [Mycobacterium tuberculosis]